jgi:tyrosinase
MPEMILTSYRNIDRLFAIWQALHEDDLKVETYVTKQQSARGSFTVPKGGDESIDTLLYPFRDTVTSWYTSKNVKRTEPFGYTYPETAGLNYPTSGSAKVALMKVIKSYYAALPDMIRESKKHNKTAGIDLLPQAELLKEIADKKITANTSEMMTLVSNMPETQTLLQASLEPSKPFIRDLAPHNKYLEWLVNIKAEKHSLDGAFTVHTFLGPVQEEQVYLWPASPHHVGTFAPLGQAGDTGCEKCQQDQRDHAQVTGQIPLTLALVERYLAGMLPDLSEESVVPYLTKNLHWRVAKVRHRFSHPSCFVSRLIVSRARASANV